MSKFKRVLSEDWLPDEFKSGNEIPVPSKMVSREALDSIIEQVEQAVLAKLAEQEPVAYLYGDEVFGVDSGAINEYTRGRSAAIRPPLCITYERQDRLCIGKVGKC